MKENVMPKKSKEKQWNNKIEMKILSGLAYDLDPQIKTLKGYITLLLN